MVLISAKRFCPRFQQRVFGFFPGKFPIFKVICIWCGYPFCKCNRNIHSVFKKVNLINLLRNQYQKYSHSRMRPNERRRAEKWFWKWSNFSRRKLEAIYHPNRYIRMHRSFLPPIIYWPHNNCPQMETKTNFTRCRIMSNVNNIPVDFLNSLLVSECVCGGENR